jgi:HD-GYP domain-containing protein (c-di-GMP phosphodiesterase class II)
VLNKEIRNIAAEAFISISLKSLRVDTELDFDLYINVNGEYVLYRANDTAFSKHSLQALIEHNVSHIFVSSKDCSGYQKYIEKHLEQILNDNTVDDLSKATIMYDTATLLIKDVLAKPTSVEVINRSVKLVETTVLHNLKNRNALHNMLRVMEFDYSTYTHSINVCTFSLALAQAAGIKDPDELSRLGLGALLHDVGKIRIDESILNKKEALTPEEWKLIKKHPQYGFEIILETDIIPHDSHYPILQHHEREDGSGYPRCRISSEIHNYSKIVAIADVFDAMTTRRVYRNAVDSYPALKVIYSDRTKFDRKLVETFTKMMGPQI